MGIPKNGKDWERELLERAKEIRKKKSGILTFEVKLVGKSIKIIISGGPTSWYEEEEEDKESS